MKQTVNERIKFLRSEMKITQRRFAELSGVSEPTLARIENSESPISQLTLQKISDAFQVSMEWIETGKGRLTFLIPQEKKADAVEAFETALESKNQEILSLQRQIEFLQEQNRQLTSIVGNLTGTGNFPKLAALNGADVPEEYSNKETSLGAKVVNM